MKRYIQCLYYLCAFIIIASITLCLLLFFSPYEIGIFVGGSMKPTLNDGDLIIALKIRPSTQLEKGMIVAYWAEKKQTIIIHRIADIGEKGEKIVTKGDANEEPDPPIIISDIENIYLFKIPRIGKFALLMKKRAGRIPFGLIIITLLAFLLGALVVVGRKIKEGKMSTIDIKGKTHL